ncbi:MAG: hypothetical protein PF444_05125 [Bacteroidales bacterium]|jgi:hypothetical protein|nr:hypothetical protein [Bacteroidales bacterium]
MSGKAVFERMYCALFGYVAFSYGSFQFVLNTSNKSTFLQLVPQKETLWAYILYDTVAGEQALFAAKQYSDL